MALRTRFQRLFNPQLGSSDIVAAAPPVPLSGIFRRFWPYARVYRRWLWLSLLFIVLAPAIDTATIWLFKLLVDRVLVPASFAPFLWLAFLYLGLTLASGIVAFCDEYLSAWLGGRFLLSLRSQVFRHLQQLSLDFFAGRRLGDLISRLTADVQAIEGFVLSGPADALSYVLRIAFFSAALFYLSWELALVSLLVLPLFWLTACRFGRPLKRTARERRRRSGSISAVVEENLANTALVQAYNRHAGEVARLERENLGSFAATLAATRLRALYSLLVDLIELAGVLIVIGFGVWELSRGALTLGGLLVFLAYLSQLYSPVRSLAGLVTGFYSASASAERIIELLDQPPAVAERPGARRLDRARGLVEFEDVSFRYPGADADALAHVSFRAGLGKILAIVGPSGAGKSTAVKLLLRFYDPSGGVIRLDGHDLRELELASLRDNAAVLFQEPLVFDATVRENIAYGRPEASEAELVAAARAADAHEFISALPQGYDTTIGQRGRRLSGGQLQRIAIARAMLRNASVLILDEPTSGLDEQATRRILAPLRRLMHGRTTILISHNPSAVAQAHTVVTLADGRLARQTPPTLTPAGAQSTDEPPSVARPAALAGRHGG